MNDLERELTEDLRRTHEEKLKALILSKELPVAVLDLDTLEKQIGKWKSIPGISSCDAVQLIDIHHPTFQTYFYPEGHIWVRPAFKSYQKAWVDAGINLPNPMSRQLDHLHSRNWAQTQGYGYVVLIDVSAGPNMSAGHREAKFNRLAQKGHAKSHPIFYANEVHWAKMWDLNQLKPSQLTKESLGRNRDKNSS